MLFRSIGLPSVSISHDNKLVLPSPRVSNEMDLNLFITCCNSPRSAFDKSADGITYASFAAATGSDGASSLLCLSNLFIYRLGLLDTFLFGVNGLASAFSFVGDTGDAGALPLLYPSKLSVLAVVWTMVRFHAGRPQLYSRYSPDVIDGGGEGGGAGFSPCFSNLYTISITCSTARLRKRLIFMSSFDVCS